MEALILAGGRGTRLKPYTITLPKPLVPVGEQPILEIVIRQLKRAGCTRVTLAVNHMADLIMAYFGTGERFGIEVRYSLETEPLGTVAPIKLVKDLPEHFLVMNGDVLTDLDYRELFNYHLNSGAKLTVSSYRREQKIDFGVLELDDQDRITSFCEKPTHYYQMSMGINVFCRDLLAMVPEGRPYGFDDLVLDMLAANAPIAAYRFAGYWLDIGQPGDFEKANEDIEMLREKIGLAF